MTPDTFETQLTAYALNDPSLSDAERTAIEARLRTDPAARQALEETRQIGHLLSKSLADEARALEPALVPTVASSLAKPKPSSFNRIVITVTSLAAVIMLAAFAGRQWLDPERNEPHAAKTVPEGTESKAAKTVPATKMIDELLVRELETEALEDSPKADAKPTSAILETTPQPLPHNEQLQAGKRPSTGQASNPTLPGPAQSTPGAPAQGLAGGAMPKGGFGGGGFPGGFGGGGSGFGGGGFGGGGGGAGLVPAPGVPGSTTAVAPRTDGLAAVPSSRPLNPTPANPTDSAPGEAVGGDSPDHYAKGTVHAPGNSYRQLVENAFVRVQGQDALSTFGVDVDTASYAIVRNYLNRNAIPHPDAVRLEEMINYFPYRDAPPDGNDPFTVRVEMAECPWQSQHRLARIALKAKPIDNSKRPPSNLVFLLDVSGSMNEPNKLPLVKEAMKLLVSQLGENDRVAIVVYAGASGLVLDSTNASKKDVIINSLDSLAAGGSTNGGAGIQLAYDVAIRNYIEKGTNRVILCTDGDWNVGTTGTDGLIKLIEDKKKSGVFLSVFGFGMGNLRDEMMVQLAGKGNGNYGYIDSLQEAKKALVEQISGTLVTVAKDVKIQIEFNPAKVAAYRLIGYEKRILAAKDFHNDKKDAGEMGAGHVVTALYELVPAGVAVTSDEKKTEGLRYQPATAAVKPKADLDGQTAKEAFVVKLRHKRPDADKSTLREVVVPDAATAYGKASEDFQFASAVAAFGMLLKQSPYKGQASYALVEELAQSAMTHDPGQYRAEFLGLVRKAKALTGQK